MKFLYLGKFSKAYSTENYVTHALRELGHEVKQYEIGRSTFSGATWHIQKSKPDVLLTAKASKAHLSRLLPWCEARGIKTVCWQWDLFFGYRRGPLPIQFNSQYLFSTDGGHNSSWEERDINHQVLRQGIHKPEAKLFRINNPQYDVGFVGSPNTYKQRRQLFYWLRSTYGSKFVHITNKRGLALNRALANVRVIVGDSYNVKNYWSNRIYEMLGRGGFLLHPETVGLSSEFVSGEHYISYPRFGRVSPNRHLDAHLKPLIAKWLPLHEEREAIKKKSMLKCLNEYTYTHRVEELIRQINHD